MQNKNQSLQFSDMSLLAPIQKAVAEEGYSQPTPIQQAAIPLVLTGKDLLGIAQTGTGKTAAFGLPLLNNLAKSKWALTPQCPRSLILVPTRELAVQVFKSLESYGRGLGFKMAVIFGGVGQNPQVQALAGGVDVLVATPGRLLDLMNQKYIQLKKVEIFVLDEADRMLDMGFIADIRRILPHLPAKKQNLFFSATMPKEVQALADTILVNPEKIAVTPQSTTVEKIDQSAMYVQRENKLNLLLHLLEDNNLYKVLVFVDMKHMANRVSDWLVKKGHLSAAIHGNKSQGARQRAIEDFKKDKIRILVATDIAARGIDIDGITHVINYDLPHIVETYVHRIGRTARAGTEGHAISFCTEFEKSYVFAIEKTTGAHIKVIRTHPFHSDEIDRARVMSAGKAKALSEAQRKENAPPRRGHSNKGRGPKQGGRQSEGGHARGRSGEGRSSEGRSSEGGSARGRSSQGRSSQERSSQGRSSQGPSSSRRGKGGGGQGPRSSAPSSGRSSSSRSR